MGNIESTFIKKSTYDRHLPRRLREEAVGNNSLFNLMLLMQPNAVQGEAATLPLRVEETKAREVGGKILFLAILDVDLQPVYTTRFVMQDGMITNIASAFMAQSTETNDIFKFSQAYLKDYGNGVGEDVPELTTQKELPVLAGV